MLEPSTGSWLAAAANRPPSAATSQRLSSDLLHRSGPACGPRRHRDGGREQDHGGCLFWIGDFIFLKSSGAARGERRRGERRRGERRDRLGRRKGENIDGEEEGQRRAHQPAALPRPRRPPPIPRGAGRCTPACCGCRLLRWRSGRRAAWSPETPNQLTDSCKTPRAGVPVCWCGFLGRTEMKTVRPPSKQSRRLQRDGRRGDEAAERRWRGEEEEEE